MTRHYGMGLVWGLALALLAATGSAALKVEKRPFGETASGQAATLYTLTNTHGMTAAVTDFGATLVSLKVPDRDGKFADVTLGYDDAAAYDAGTSYFGCIAGRYGNRIAKGKFTLDGKEYSLATNNAPNHLHGGDEGFGQKLWRGKTVTSSGSVGVAFTYTSVDGEEGYPGTLTCTMTYTLTDANELKFSYEAATDKPTVLNLTQHSYWNLHGHGEGAILDHELTLNCSHYTPVDGTAITTGEIAPVEGTDMDFRKPVAIGARIEKIQGGGYDHNYVIDSTGGLTLAATVYEPKSGRVMEVHTTEPGVQFYAGIFLNGVKCKEGKSYIKNGGLCLETQKFPDSPNKPNFPSCVLRPGETYTHETVHKFYTK
ncbi:MAG: galactose mutarotase [Candidatus Hydrogenedentes bacterium]|nr:galactose mutarotase [Candidatus Hydrogenedentota bacterium]